jgi:peptide/nickel transport system substrate-binding protein
MPRRAAFTTLLSRTGFAGTGLSRKCRAVVLALGVWPFLAAPGAAQPTPEPPLLAEPVAAGVLPPMAERLPRNPRVIEMAAIGRTPGNHGGEIRMVMADQRDLRMMTLYSYARLVVFDTQHQLVPDILESFEVSEGRSFTLTLREGHRWSDGHPLTTEDFRYWWEDVANDPRLSPNGPPVALLPNDKRPTVEVLDARRIRYTWAQPNPAFLPALAGGQPVYILMPAHYMKHAHARYADKDKLAASVKALRLKDWGALHEQRSRQYRPENPDLPTLEAWRNRTSPPAERFVFERNPFYHRVDERGLQLPYLDRIVMNTATAALIPAKVGAGDSDLQARYLQFENYTFLKVAAKRRDFSVKLWERAEGARLTIYPNLNASDPGWRAVLRDRRVRQAMSLAINRQDINNVIYYGLAKPGANTMIEGGPLYNAARQAAFAVHDPKQANALLDEAGLNRRDWDGVRLLPDGRRAEITIETAGDNSEEVDAIELITENFRAVGLLLYARASQRELFRRRVLIGDTMLSMSIGLDNGIASPETDPDALAPTNAAQYHWPRFGQFHESNGRNGDEPDLPEVRALADLRKSWSRSETPQERIRIWNEMLDIHAREIFTIGILNRTLQPVVVSNRLRNVPDKAYFSFDPGSFFGVHHMDAFWLSDVKAGPS